MNPLTLIDFYKADHKSQYPHNTTLIYSNLTARKTRTGEVETVFFGLQYFIKEYLIKRFNEDFFDMPKDYVVSKYKRIMDYTLGKDAIDVSHIEALHDLGYLPIEIKAVKEGTLVPIRCAMLTIKNTLPQFYWLTNYFETIMSCIIWGGITSATTAYRYKKLFNKYADETLGNRDFVQWQGHDFSFRGMFGLEAAIISGAGHLLSFTGTDSIPSIEFLETYYGVNIETELVGASVPATEHSVMCAAGKENEFETYKRLITEVYPNGIVSIVSDTWDLWKVLTVYMPLLKPQILKRNGKVVIRPDSGDPADILCGVGDKKGVVELLWEVFGGRTNELGFKELDPHVGYIYGDSITPERAEDICSRLKAKGFASQGVFGIGSYTYQYVTRDTYGMAMKATYCEIDGKAQNIFKDPITDDGMKKSATGLLSVQRHSDGLVMQEKCTWEQEKTGELQTVFMDGKLIREQTLSEIRKVLNLHEVIEPEYA